MTPAPTKSLLSYFDDCHRATFHVPAVISGAKDAALMARLWKSHPDHVRPLMVRFFAERNEFVERCGFTVGIFASQFARLLTQYLKDQRRQLRESAVDWWEECKTIHGGECQHQYQHELRKMPVL